MYMIAARVGSYLTNADIIQLIGHAPEYQAQEVQLEVESIMRGKSSSSQLYVTEFRIVNHAHRGHVDILLYRGNDKNAATVGVNLLIPEIREFEQLVDDYEEMLGGERSVKYEYDTGNVMYRIDCNKVSSLDADFIADRRSKMIAVN